MGLFFTDQSADKDAVRKAIQRMDGLSDLDKIEERSKETLDAIEGIVTNWNVDTRKFMALLRSQILSGNIKGALKIVDIVPPRRVTPFALGCAVVFAVIATAIIYNLRF